MLQIREFSQTSTHVGSRIALHHNKEDSKSLKSPRVKKLKFHSSMNFLQTKTLVFNLKGSSLPGTGKSKTRKMELTTSTTRTIGIKFLMINHLNYLVFLNLRLL